MAADWLLAGARTAASLPDSVWRPWRSRLSSFQYALEDATADGRALGADDARRTRKSERALVSLRIRAARGQADAVSASIVARLLPNRRTSGEPWSPPLREGRGFLLVSRIRANTFGGFLTRRPYFSRRLRTG